jgi:hypothetical protein
MKVSVAQQTDTILVHRITDYLERHDKSADAQVLQDTVTRMRQVVLKDLMQPRDQRAGKESNTLYSGPCARKAWLTYDGAEREPLRARTVLKFLLGDLVELSVLVVARLAGCEIVDNNIDLSVLGHDRVNVPVHPDGRYVHTDGTQYNIEIKSCDSKTFDRWLGQGGPNDAWGYLSQASMEVEAWREYGYPINGTLFLAVSTGTRQGSLAEFYAPHDPALVEAWHERRRQALSSVMPLVPFMGQSELEFIRGKELPAEKITKHGDPTPRTNEKGAVYGWDVPTGRTIVPLTCTYCDFMQRQCWPMAEMEMDGGKPVWVIPPVPSGPVLTAQNVCQQFRLCLSTQEWEDLWRGWLSEVHFHTEEEKGSVRGAADDARKRIEWLTKLEAVSAGPQG